MSSLPLIRQLRILLRTPTAAIQRMIFCTMVLTFVVAIAPAAQAAETETDKHIYAIPAGPLATQLNQFAAQSGIYLASDSQLTAGKSSPAFNGSYTLTEGFSRLLNDQGLMAECQPNGSYILKKIPEGDEMVVVGDINYGSMTEDTSSYTTRSMSTATRLSLSPRETPQSVSVVTRQRMNDQNMTSLDDAMRQVTGVNVLNESSCRGYTNAG